ncbi:hypothetical protein BDB01DRAFT_838001 [Pilobolus umbonatus]|nr:hypothetical protein BDB01DRAFT_838001 [Pilobolus umbonatus]
MSSLVVNTGLKLSIVKEIQYRTLQRSIGQALAILHIYSIVPIVLTYLTQIISYELSESDNAMHEYPDPSLSRIGYLAFNIQEIHMSTKNTDLIPLLLSIYE